jgi:hypothetical protein
MKFVAHKTIHTDTHIHKEKAKPKRQFKGLCIDEGKNTRKSNSPKLLMKRSLTGE